MSLVVGIVAHAVISIIIGVIYAIVVSRMSSHQRYRRVILQGLINGLFWWIVGAQIIADILLGMSPLVTAFTPFALLDLIGHFVYGVVTALIFVWLVRRNSQARGAQVIS